MMRKRNTAPEDIKDVVNKVIKYIEKKHPGKREKILNAWQRIVSKKASAHSRPVSIKRHVLTIEVGSSAWLYALSLEKQNILDKIKKELGEDIIKDLRFRMGNIS